MTEVERTEGRRERLRVLVFSASLRKKSLNTRLARLVVASIQGHDGTVDFADMREFDCPSYDGDLEAAEGLPAGAQAFRTRLEAANAFVIVSPEYNGSMPGVLKNAIDWVSRARPQPFNERHGLLLSASPSMVGGNRGLWALRMPLEHLGARIFPNMFSLAQAHQAFDDEGLADARLRARFEDTIESFLDLAEASTHYPCIKRAWVEFLGERPDPAVDRVDA
jgi:chromate reductase, NAD(P)H dehydrogenase (quinone)